MGKARLIINIYQWQYVYLGDQRILLKTLQFKRICPTQACTTPLGLCGRRGGEIRRHCQEAARSNRRASPGSVPVTSQWCAQEAVDQAARWSTHYSKRTDLCPADPATPTGCGCVAWRARAHACAHPSSATSPSSKRSPRRLARRRLARRRHARRRHARRRLRSAACA